MLKLRQGFYATTMSAVTVRAIKYTWRSLSSLIKRPAVTTATAAAAGIGENEKQNQSAVTSLLLLVMF